jgi:hypothetical protein
MRLYALRFAALEQFQTQAGRRDIKALRRSIGRVNERFFDQPRVE